MPFTQASIGSDAPGPAKARAFSSSQRGQSRSISSRTKASKAVGSMPSGLSSARAINGVVGVTKARRDTRPAPWRVR